MSYTYPDVDDKLTVLNIGNKEPYPGYWDGSESFVLTNVIGSLKKKPQKRLLDAGAGEGRLSILFSPYFDEVVAIEPDVRRIEKARVHLKGAGVTNTTTITATLQDAQLEDESFDVVILSHVIQHIPTTDVPCVMERAYRLLKPQGRLVLMTCHARMLHDSFAKEFERNGKSVCKRISEREFNRLTTNDKGILPIHYFTTKSLYKHLHDFDILETLVFHELLPKTPLDFFFDRDRLINTTLLRPFFGVDIFILARKK